MQIRRLSRQSNIRRQSKIGRMQLGQNMGLAKCQIWIQLLHSCWNFGRLPLQEDKYGYNYNINTAARVLESYRYKKSKFS